jgi:hypothetical protein
MTSSETNAQPSVAEKKRPLWHRVLAKEAPFTVAIVLALIGIGYADFAPKASAWYWQALAIVYAILCIVTQWSSATVKKVGRMRLIWTQVLHWGAFLVAMRLAFLPVITENMSSEITGLVLLYTLALSTFLAGIYLHWKISVVGVFLAVGVVAVAYLDQAAMLMVVLAILIVAGFLFWDRITGNKS